MRDKLGIPVAGAPGIDPFEDVQRGVMLVKLHGELRSSAARRCATMPQEFLGRMMRTPEIAPRQLDSRTHRSQSKSRRLACSSDANSMGELLNEMRSCGTILFRLQMESQ